MLHQKWCFTDNLCEYFEEDPFLFRDNLPFCVFLWLSGRKSHFPRFGKTLPRRVDGVFGAYACPWLHLFLWSWHSFVHTGFSLLTCIPAASRGGFSCPGFSWVVQWEVKLLVVSWSLFFFLSFSVCWAALFRLPCSRALGLFLETQCCLYGEGSEEQRKLILLSCYQNSSLIWSSVHTG